MLETPTVLRLAEAMGPRLRALVYLAGFCGLRPGELLGLERRDIDLLHRVVHVRRQAHEITGQGRVLTAPKTDAGNRTVSLPAVVAEELDKHLDAHVASDADSPVFNRLSGLPLRRADLSNAWRDACLEVGLAGVHPHDLRHHAATVIARNPDVTLKELMATIGHSSPCSVISTPPQSAARRLRATSTTSSHKRRHRRRPPPSAYVRREPRHPRAIDALHREMLSTGNSL